MRFQGIICPEKYQIDQIHNGRFDVIIDFNMDNIGKTVSDSQTITGPVKQKKGGICPEKCQLDQI